MKISKCFCVCLVLTLFVVSISAVKKKRGLYHGLPGFAIPLGHRPYHPSPYAKFPGFYRGFGGALPPGYALFPGSATVTSYQRNFPKVPAVFTPNYIPTFGVPATGVVRPVTSFAPVAPVAPVAPLAPVFPQIPAQVPNLIPLDNTQQTSFFATYPQKPIIPVAIPLPDKPKTPIILQKPLYTAFSNLLPNGIIPSGVFNPAVAIPSAPPTFVGVPIAGPTISTPTVATTTVSQTGAPQQPWRPILVNHVTPSPTTTSAFKPSINLLPPFTLSSNAQQGQQIYISSTPATYVQDSQQHHQQQQQQQTLLDLEASQHYQNQEEGNGAFNGQPYDVASNHGRYSGPSSYDVDITHNGYQKK
ncbi:uncharacterized protein LOC129758212 isoform X2 [Uranotaenia lowii]|uniref:uncharacterized protein LOC129758212 isoform X2 n=1 Tax=Uranotaenia lowii TaxID=190385 RepID=UPI00247A3729|nr:uncharacterized protein LOC129758212 isoform X2 [Uranotaenia lowii]